MKRLCPLLFALSLAACPSSSEPAPEDADTPDADAPDADAPDASDIDPADGGPADADLLLDAGPPPARCDDEGATRVASCGACGNAQERCVDGTWERTSECLNQRACIPGSLEESPADLCQTRRRLCLDSCDWGDWDLAGAPGECDPGDTDDDGSCGPGRITRRTCDDACRWQTECESPCGPLRDSPPELSEVCVPAGPFYRGDPAHARPFTEVYLSTFVAARHPATKRRFLECRAAGACTVTMIPYVEGVLAEQPEDFPALVIRQAAIEFCAWDGGRLLMTSAQWEKAQRGPVPSRRLWAIAESEYPCDILPAEGCPGVAPGSLPIPVAVGSVPETRGYYGVEHQMLTRAVMRDTYHPNYESTAESLVDPVGPAVPFNDDVTSRGVTARVQHNSRIGSAPAISAGSFGAAIYCVREIR
ncbi:MAG: SUMF1/EgtB/PvdO family nonheme iron enzyme [Myxococcales bacterium]|nr:SUMF1/EgtB/PvdO family nonheme iron enzyme [Myxococcales bacterium]